MYQNSVVGNREIMLARAHKRSIIKSTHTTQNATHMHLHRNTHPTHFVGGVISRVDLAWDRAKASRNSRVDHLSALFNTEWHTETETSNKPRTGPRQVHSYSTEQTHYNITTLLFLSLSTLSLSHTLSASPDKDTLRGNRLLSKWGNDSYELGIVNQNKSDIHRGLKINDVTCRIERTRGKDGIRERERRGEEKGGGWERDRKK